ncbi:Uncharacterised protein [Mycobacteroides abscessus subsp. abscessus]|nr:Uncharacterised protein [Mycobacteroides abscessus subsp. abscessus]
MALTAHNNFVPFSVYAICVWASRLRHGDLAQSADVGCKNTMKIARKFPHLIIKRSAPSECQNIK